MSGFLDTWTDASMTSLGFFWTALWAFSLGYAISAMIQVFVTRERMQRAIGETGPRSVALGTLFGFLSSSCSFAALSATRSLFQKGAGLVPSLAFLLASTNLVVELGIVIVVFLSWQFVVGEYVGGILLILTTWLVVSLTLPAGLVRVARERAGEAGAADSGAPPDWRRLLRSGEGWIRVARRYFAEWQMVWKDVIFGFTVAGIISVAVPSAFFRTLFVGSDTADGPAWWQIVLHTVIGPVAAFFTFIGSMGNIPLAAVLFSSGVSFAGVMAFIFSDLVVFPVLRISAGYFGRRMAIYILVVFLVSLSISALVLHAAFDALGALPDRSAVTVTSIEPGEHFALDYTTILNVLFLAMAAAFSALVLQRRSADSGGHHGGHAGDGGEGASWDDYLLRALGVGSAAWLVGGVVLFALRRA